MSVNANPCCRYRETISLLVAGALSEAELAEVEAHLAECERCRSHQAELMVVARSLSELGRHLPDLEPTPAMKSRWARAVEASSSPTQAMPRSFVFGLREWWQVTWVNHRPALAGLAAIWLLALFFRVTTPEVEATRSLAAAPLSREFLLSLRSRDLWTVLPEEPHEAAAEHPGPARPVPPRSERRDGRRNDAVTADSLASTLVV